MVINTPEDKRIIDDYDIVFETGMMMPLSLDKAIGDTINFTENLIIVKLVVKPSPTDPTKLLPAEDTTIFLRHVVSIQHRRREITELTPEQKHEWQRKWQEMTAHPTVQ